MDIINNKILLQAYDFILKNCDKLYKKIFEYHFLNGDPLEVIDSLKEYQNEDGGFGHGLEPDFLLPNSSPMATTIAQQILNDINDNILIKDIINYYTGSFDKNRNRWWSVPIEVNSYPHAPWWTYDKKNKSTIIDNQWGNPSSEIIGFLYKWREYVSGIDVYELLKYSIDHLLNTDKIESEHEIYCYLRMFEYIDKEYQEMIYQKIAKSIKDIVCLNESKWNNYVPKPLDFIQNKSHPLFHEVKNYVDKHCDFLLQNINEGLWFPTWEWGAYAKDWEKSKKNWTGIITIKNFRILKEFNRLE